MTKKYVIGVLMQSPMSMTTEGTCTFEVRIVSHGQAFKPTDGLVFDSREAAEAFLLSREPVDSPVTIVEVWE